MLEPSYVGVRMTRLNLYLGLYFIDQDWVPGMDIVFEASHLILMRAPRTRRYCKVQQVILRYG